jgi:hypothetical protein
MAATITTRYPINGSRDFVAIVQIVGDAAGDVTNSLIIDVASLTGVPKNFKIKSINYNLVGFAAVLNWDATTPTQAIALPQYDNFTNLHDDSGINLDNDGGAGVTGKLMVSTSGLAAKTWGTIIIKGVHN